MFVPARQLIMIRAVTEVAAEPDPLFTFFTSKAGYKVIDPACTNHDDPPFRLWSERCAAGLEAARFFFSCLAVEDG